MNRLIEANSYTSVDNTFGSGGDPKYHNAFTYDANGNILTQKRHNSSGDIWEDLTYHYLVDGNDNPLRNRLYHVRDYAGATNPTYNNPSGAMSSQLDANNSDLEDQGHFDAANTETDNNYKYDAEGRLIQDLQEDIVEIQWRVDGKVKKIIKEGGSNVEILTFDYDAMGNRIAKHIETASGTRLSSTYYILDAQGNPLAMYELDYEVASFELTERQIYGSARLGSLKTKVDVFGTAYTAYSDEITTHAIGDRNYELSNHLGNVLTVVSDKLHALDNGNGVVSGYTADLVMSCDYSPFGVTLDGRGVEGSYRYRFQSQEMDDEIKGDGNSVNYKYRMHDPRVGRFFAVDPLAREYPFYAPYTFSGNRVTDSRELEGLEPIDAINPKTNEPYFKPKYRLNLPNGDAVIVYANAQGCLAMTQEDRNLLNTFSAQGYTSSLGENFGSTNMTNNGATVNINAGIGGISRHGLNANGIPNYASEGLFRVNSIQAPSQITQIRPEIVYGVIDNYGDGTNLVQNQSMKSIAKAGRYAGRDARIAIDMNRRYRLVPDGSEVQNETITIGYNQNLTTQQLEEFKNSFYSTFDSEEVIVNFVPFDPDKSTISGAQNYVTVNDASSFSYEESSNSVPTLQEIE